MSRRNNSKGKSAKRDSQNRNKDFNNHKRGEPNKIIQPVGNRREENQQEAFSENNSFHKLVLKGSQEATIKFFTEHIWRFLFWTLGTIFNLVLAYYFNKRK